jgi:hypothetical protein
MADAEATTSIWTTVFNYLGTLSWPLIVLVIICIFRNPIATLIARIKSAKWKDVTVEFGDMVKAYSPEKKSFNYGVIQPATTNLVTDLREALAVEVPAELEKEFAKETKELDKLERKKTVQEDPSFKRAMARIKEDAKQTGYVRGRPYKRVDGKWVVIWD